LKVQSSEASHALSNTKKKDVKVSHSIHQIELDLGVTEVSKIDSTWDKKRLQVDFKSTQESFELYLGESVMYANL